MTIDPTRAAELVAELARCTIPDPDELTIDGAFDEAHAFAQFIQRAQALAQGNPA